MSHAAIDRLGERLRSEPSQLDLNELDAYRRSFRGSYDLVVLRLQAELGVEPAGRPAKSTSAIIGKLNRGSMRLSQMQDISGCRIVVPNTLHQDEVLAKLNSSFSASVFDRRHRPSFGYRAVHVIAQLELRSIEIQVRTGLQHRWAEVSEKFADLFGTGVKYGSGPPELRTALETASGLVAKLEELEPLVSSLEELERLRIMIHAHLTNLESLAEEGT